MNLQRLSIDAVSGVSESELELRPGLNLLLAPTEGMREGVADAVRKALAQLAEPGALPRSVNAVEDAQVLSAAQLREFGVIVRKVGVSRAALAAGKLGSWRWSVVMDRLRQESERYGSPKGPGPELQVLLDELGQVQRESRAISDRLSEAPKLHAKLKKREEKLKEAERVEAEQAQLLAQALKLEAAAAQLPRLEAVEAECARRSRLAGFPEDGVARLEALRANLLEVKRAREPVLQAAAELQTELAALGPGDADVLETELRTMLDVYRERAEQLRELPSRQAAFLERRKKVEASVGALPAGAAQAPVGEAYSVGDALLEANGFLAQRELSWRTAKKVRERIEAEVRKLTVEVSKLPPSAQPVVKARLGALVRVRALKEERDRVMVERQRRETRLGDVRVELEKMVPPEQRFQLWKLVAALLVLGALAVAALVLLSPERALQVALGAGVVGMGALVVQRVFAFLDGKKLEAHYKLQRGKESERRRLEVDLENLGRRGADLEKELLSASTEAGLPPSAAQSRVELTLHEAQVEARRFERRQRLSAQLEVYAGMLAFAVSDETRAKVDRDVAESRVSGLERRFMGRGGLSGVEADATMLRQRLLDVRTEANALAADRKACDAWVVAFLEQAGRLGLRAESPEATSERIAARLEELRATAASLRSIDERRTAVDQELLAAHRSCAEREELIDALLTPWGCVDEQSFRMRAVDANLYRASVRELQDATRRVEGTAGMPVKEVREQLQALGGRKGLGKRLRGMDRRYRQALGKMRDAILARDAARAQLEQWGNAERVTMLNARAETLDHQASRMLARFAVDRLALGLLTRRMKQWDREQRPKVVEIASETFGRLTGGAYVHVDVEAEDNEELVVQDARWKASSAEHLPQAAREALFLAFRLAALQELADRRVALPLLVDELFAQADGEAMRNGLRVLARVAERHQVILVTSDPRLRRVLEAEKAAHVQELHAAPRLRSTEPLPAHV